MAGSDDDEIDRQIANLSFKVRRELVTTIRAEAGKLADAVKSAAPVKTGALRDSVKVRRTRNDLTLYVEAGGAATTKYYDRDTGYEREVVIDGRSNEGIAKQADGAGVSYDYSMAIEYGATDHPAEPFFFPTIRAMEDSINANIEAAVEKALSE
ncbi:phage protein, HK97 gp10 family [Afipia felis]|uniref:Phage protein, HK97 gp10 family n=1 Tax=Afipia felis TaxID=1035 RepID=A0A090MQ48_AFIFE|nr:HK97 gp10 family phage protein [Afipia felis]CEG09486.1 phage protein, HK97 gp10 family [Afipia felis]